MTGFLRFATTTTVAVTLLGAVLIAVLQPAGIDVTASVRGQVETDAADLLDDDNDLLSSPVALTPGTAIALLDSLRPEFAPESLPATQRVVLSRDPFRPVIPRPIEEGAPPPDGSGDPTDPSVPTDPTDPSDPDPSDPGSPDACAGDDTETVCDGIVVTLDGFADDGAALVTVDGVQYSVAEGQEFASSFRVLASSPPCVTLLYGDESFSICTGVTVLK